MTSNDPSHIHTLFQEAFNAGDVDSLVALYEPNAVLIVKGHPVTGLQEIRTAYQNILARRPRMAGGDVRRDSYGIARRLDC